MSVNWPNAFKVAGGLVWIAGSLGATLFGWDPTLFGAGLIAIGFGLPLAVSVG